MKTQKSWLPGLTSILALSLPLLSVAGDKVGNGGDMCENRFKIVRNDLLEWIQKGGPDSLSLPPDVSLASYKSLMVKFITTARVSCTDEKVFVGQAEKTCKNFSAPRGGDRILCNARLFLNETSESDQYVLIHHEYAGLAKIEQSHGEDSNYEISNQIAGFLEDTVMKKLAIKPAQPETTRTTDSGHVFTRNFDYPALGEAWKDEAGTVWGQTIVFQGRENRVRYSEAIDYCRAAGMKVPTQTQFQQLAKELGYGSAQGYSPYLRDGKTQVLPHLLSNPDKSLSWFWTSSSEPGSIGGIYTFGSDNGRFGYTQTEVYGMLRCVAP